MNDMRRAGSILIVALAAVLSVSHHRISLLPRQPSVPLTHHRSPRPSRAELPGASAASLLNRKESAAPSASVPRQNPWALTSASDPDGKRDFSLREFRTEPDYLRPDLISALQSDLPPPAASL
jgi:hypothetical protein